MFVSKKGNTVVLPRVGVELKVQLIVVFGTKRGRTVVLPRVGGTVE